MPVTIKSRIVSNVFILDVAGRFAVGEDSLTDSVKTCLAEGRQHFLLNLAGVPYLGSWGMTQIIAAWTAIRGRSGTMALVAPSKAARKVLQFTKLDTVFPIYASEVDAFAIHQPVRFSPFVPTPTGVKLGGWSSSTVFTTVLKRKDRDESSP